MIYDEQDRRPIYSKNADNVVPIASITKLMTAMVILDAKLPMDEPISISAEDRDHLKGSRSRMRNGMTLPRGRIDQAGFDGFRESCRGGFGAYLSGRHAGDAGHDERQGARTGHGFDPFLRPDRFAQHQRFDRGGSGQDGDGGAKLSRYSALYHDGFAGCTSWTVAVRSITSIPIPW